MKKRFTMVAACLLMGMSAAWAQNTKVTGHVVDENGEPVIGASVVVKGTTIGTVTSVGRSDGRSLRYDTQSFVYRFSLRDESGRYCCAKDFAR